MTTYRTSQRLHEREGHAKVSWAYYLLRQALEVAVAGGGLAEKSSIVGRRAMSHEQSSAAPPALVQNARRKEGDDQRS